MLLQSEKETSEVRYTEVKDRHLREIQIKDKLILAKGKPGPKSHKAAFLCLFQKAKRSARSKIQM